MVQFSINANPGALSALRNLTATAQQLGKVQTRVNTGLRVSSAKDNAAIFAIAQNLRADLRGVNAVKGSLDRGQSVLDVTISAAETISDLLIELQELAVSANDSGLDGRSLAAINEGFQAILKQIDSVAEQATFNGANLINDAPDTLNVVVGFDGEGLVSTIKVQGEDLTSDGTVATTADPLLRRIDDIFSLDDLNTTDAVTATSIELVDTPDAAFDATTGEFDFSAFTPTLDGGAGDDTLSFTATIGGQVITFEATGDFDGGTAGLDTTTQDFLNLTPESFKVVDVDGNPVNTASVEIFGSEFIATRPDLVNVSLSDIDLTDDFFRAASIQVVANTLQNVNSVLAEFGALSRQVQLQSDFATKLTDTLEIGIGNLVDADLARESANLQALQVKQELGIQALSIANQAPQSLLQLFR